MTDIDSIAEGSLVPDTKAQTHGSDVIAAYERFVAGVDALSFFLVMTLRALDEGKAEIADLTEKLGAIDRGESSPPPGKDEIGIELTRSEFDLMKEIVSWEQAQIVKHPDMLREMAFVYLVALFDAFLVDSLLAFLKARPDALKSRRTLTYEEIVDNLKDGDLVETLARRELMDLSYKSMRDQLERLEHWGIDASSSGVDSAELVEIRARRNLFVHNSGIVNEIYVEAVGHDVAVIGERLEVSLDYFEATDTALRAFAHNVFEQLVQSKGIALGRSHTATPSLKRKLSDALGILKKGDGAS